MTGSVFDRLFDAVGGDVGGVDNYKVLIIDPEYNETFNTYLKGYQFFLPNYFSNMPSDENYKQIYLNQEDVAAPVGAAVGTAEETKAVSAGSGALGGDGTTAGGDETTAGADEPASVVASRTSPLQGSYGAGGIELGQGSQISGVDTTNSVVTTAVV